MRITNVLARPAQKSRHRTLKDMVLSKHPGFNPELDEVLVDDVPAKEGAFERPIGPLQGFVVRKKPTRTS